MSETSAYNEDQLFEALAAKDAEIARLQSLRRNDWPANAAEAMRARCEAIARAEDEGLVEGSVAARRIAAEIAALKGEEGK